MACVWHVQALHKEAALLRELRALLAASDAGVADDLRMLGHPPLDGATMAAAAGAETAGSLSARCSDSALASANASFRTEAAARSSRDTAEMPPRCGRDAAEMQASA